MQLKRDKETGEMVPTASAITTVQWKTPNNHDTDYESYRTGTATPEESLTKQEFIEDQDINTIMARFQRLGEAPPMALPEHFIDMTHRPTYLEIHERLAQASAMFYELKPELRAQHLNDPARWADAVSQAAARHDIEGLQKLGVAATAEPQEPPEGDPPSRDTPAGKSAQKAAPAAELEKETQTKGATAPKPPSDNGK